MQVTTSIETTTSCAPSQNWVSICNDCQCEAWDFEDNNTPYADCQQHALDNGFTHMSYKDDNKCRLGHEADCDEIVTTYKTGWDTWRLDEEPCGD